MWIDGCTEIIYLSFQSYKKKKKTRVVVCFDIGAVPSLDRNMMLQEMKLRFCFRTLLSLQGQGLGLEPLEHDSALLISLKRTPVSI